MTPYVNHDPKSKGFDYTDSDELERLYWDEGLSTTEMGEKAGVSGQTIHYHMDKNDIPRRDRIESVKKAKRVEWASFYTDAHDTSDGYEVWKATHSKLKVHRLLAVAKYGYDAVCGMNVHHKNEIPWDNRPDNIELMEHGEHTRHHHTGKRNPQKLTEETVRDIRSRIESGERDYHAIADDYDVTYRTIISVKNGDTWNE